MTGGAAGGQARVPLGATLLLALSVGIVLSDSSVVTLALPAILREFDASVSAVAWVLIAFNLALALAAVGAAWLVRGRTRSPGGSLGAGGRLAYVVSVTGFAAASLACAAAPSLDVLIAARAAQGVAGAVVVAAALALLLRRTSRSRAIGLWAAAGVLGGAVGPAAGGFLTEAFSCRRCSPCRRRSPCSPWPARSARCPRAPPSCPKVVLRPEVRTVCVRCPRSRRSRSSRPRCRRRCFCS